MAKHLRHQRRPGDGAEAVQHGHRPLQLATLLGFMISTLAFIAIPVVIVLRILGSYLPGQSGFALPARTGFVNVAQTWRLGRGDLCSRRTIRCRRRCR